MESLTRIGMVKYMPSRKYTRDQRKKKAWAVYEYRDKNGDEYRRSFWAVKGTSRAEFDHIAPLEY